jgi:hypothetical protein
MMVMGQVNQQQMMGRMQHPQMQMGDLNPKP